MKETLKLAAWAIAIVAGLGIFAFVAKLVMAPISVANTAVSSGTTIVNRTISADNILSNYEWFYDTNAAIESRRGQIKAHADRVQREVDPAERSRLSMELGAMQQTCRDLVTRYNANAAKLNRAAFRANSLPDNFDIRSCEA